jgi:hypothetical protein
VIANKNRKTIENKMKALRLERKLLHAQGIDKKEVGAYLNLRNLVRRMASSGMLRRVDLVRTDVSEACIASIIRVTCIGELGTALAETSN